MRPTHATTIWKSSSTLMHPVEDECICGLFFPKFPLHYVWILVVPFVIIQDFWQRTIQEKDQKGQKVLCKKSWMMTEGATKIHILCSLNGQ